MSGEPEFSRQQVRIMLTNLEWLATHRHSDDDPRMPVFDAASDMVMRGDGGYEMDQLADEGNTPATSVDGWDSGEGR